ncbi:MAG: oxidoreductase domain protein, partial [Desertimonas sp.]|nr:oxidoreductase domain protein [Desertimonas sp.]
MRAAIVGTGWMAAVHTEALRRIGVEVVGMVGSSPERTRGKANPLLPQPYDSLDELLAVDALDSVHITSPNDVHAEQARAALAAGKHVVCEKPLGVDSSETAELVGLAAEAGVVNAVCFNARFYPLNQHAAALVRAGEIGQPRLISGQYLQDWLLLETDWNWRLDADRQGALRAVADIGSHWLDLVQFVSGQRVVEVFADLHTFVTERRRPVGEVETFAAAGVDADVPRVREQMESDDAAGLLLRFDGGGRGVCTISQVSGGRRNRLAWEIDGDASSLAWAADDPDHLWIGHRGRPNEIVEKDPALLT